MNTLNKVCVVLAICFVPVTGFAFNNSDFHEIAEINWCPQICPNNDEQQGYISEILNEIVKGFYIKFVRNEYPWSRAIRNVKLGTSVALSAPAKQEAPNLIYPNIPIGIQRMCFFVNRQSNWQYSGIESLSGIIIGAASDTSIEELNQYAKNHPKNFQYQPYHDRFISQNVKKLNKNRIDTFIFTRNSTLYELKYLGLLDEIKIAGCVSSAPVYIAFTPATHLTELSLTLVKEFDSRMLELIAEGTVDAILSKYQVGFNGKDLLKYQTNALVKD